MVADLISGTEDHLQQKCQIHDYQKKDKMLVSRILLLQLKYKLGHTKPLMGPHAAHGLDIADLEL